MRRMRKPTIAANTLLEHFRTTLTTTKKDHIIEDHHTVVRCTGDATAMVVSTVLDYACTGGNVVLIAANTDLLIILIYVWNSIIGEITMNAEVTKKHKAIKFNIGNTAERINGVRTYLILVHAFSECNTTSAAYEQVNPLVLKI